MAHGLISVVFLARIVVVYLGAVRGEDARRAHDLLGRGRIAGKLVIVPSAAV